MGLLTDPANDLFVPDLFHVECANIFWKQVQRGNANATQVTADLARLTQWRLVATPTFSLMPDALDLALTHTISAYDACYVALAARLGFPLITADQRLVQKLADTPNAATWLGVWTPPP